MHTLLNTTACTPTLLELFYVKVFATRHTLGRTVAAVAGTRDQVERPGRVEVGEVGICSC